MPTGDAPAPTVQGLEGGRRPSACCRIGRTLAWLESVRPGWAAEIRGEFATLERERDEKTHLAMRFAGELHELRTAVRNLRDVKGRHHTQQAMERLMELLPENANMEAPNA